MAAVLACLLLWSGCTPQPAPGSPAAVIDAVALDKAIEDFITSDSPQMDNVRAVMVVVDGQTRAEYYRHSFAAGDHEHVHSVTKSVVSALVGIAIGDGLIPSLDAPLRDLLPEYRSVMAASATGVTLRQLMNHSAGFVDDDLPEDVGKKVLAGQVDLVKWSLSKGPPKAPGNGVLYSNVGAHLVAAVLHSALQRNPATKGQSVLDFARARLFDPLGIDTRPAVEGTISAELDTDFTGPGFGWVRLGELEFGAAGLRLRAQDMAKLGQLHLDDGIWDGTRLLPEGWVAEVTAPNPLNSDYGLLWMRDFTGWYYARGWGGQRIVVVPNRRAVIVTLSDTKDSDYPLDEVHELIERVLLPALG